MSSKVILTGDGSHSLFSDQYQAAYHSHYGAIDESVTIFVSGGLHYLKRQGLKSINVFEMGFGTGLNAYLSSLFSSQHNIQISYDSIELHPVNQDIIQSLNYKQVLNQPELFDHIHYCKWEEAQKISNTFQLKKIQGDIFEYHFDSKYDLIIFDAFAPSCQPDLWKIDLHQKIYNHLNQGACLLTYCAQGAFKRMLKSLGYSLEMLPGPSKKKEITRAVKS